MRFTEAMAVFYSQWICFVNVATLLIPSIEDAVVAIDTISDPTYNGGNSMVKSPEAKERLLKELAFTNTTLMLDLEAPKRVPGKILATDGRVLAELTIEAAKAGAKPTELRDALGTKVSSKKHG